MQIREETGPAALSVTQMLKCEQRPKDHFKQLAVSLLRDWTRGTGDADLTHFKSICNQTTEEQVSSGQLLKLSKNIQQKSVQVS